MLGIPLCKRLSELLPKERPYMAWAQHRRLGQTRTASNKSQLAGADRAFEAQRARETLYFQGESVPRLYMREIGSICPFGFHLPSFVAFWASKLDMFPLKVVFVWGRVLPILPLKRANCTLGPQTSHFWHFLLRFRAFGTHLSNVICPQIGQIWPKMTSKMPIRTKRPIFTGPHPPPSLFLARSLLRVKGGGGWICWTPPRGRILDAPPSYTPPHP